MANWTEQEKYSSQVAIEYNADIQYDDPAYTYSGKKITIWTFQSEN